MPNTFPAAYAPLHLIGLVLVCIFVSMQTVLAQAPPRREVDISAFLQEILPTPDDDNADLYESLLQLYSNPLDLNTVTRDELAATLILSETQLNAFFEYKNFTGPLISLYELQAIHGFDLPTIQRLLPFVTVASAALPLRTALSNPTQHFLLIRSERGIEQAKGFTNPTPKSRSRYAGPPETAYIRYRYARNEAYSFGLTMDKDAGEKWWSWHGKREIFGTDFTSFHVQLQNRGRVKNLILGDFQMQAGQGMMLSAGFSLGKGSEVIRTTYRSTLGLKPYTSGMEANFFRGVAATIDVGKKLALTVFYSGNKRDGTTDATSLEPDKTIVTSLPLTGYHRTETEIEKHNNLTERNIGLHLLRPVARRGQWGLTALYTSYGLSLQKREAPYNQYEFSGRQNLLLGVHGDYRWQNLHFSGEAARSTSGGVGAIGSIIAGLGRKWDMTLLARHYDRHFHTFYGNPFAENSRPINENGIYAAARYMPEKHWQISIYYDWFRFPWLRYQVDAPSRGADYFMHILWKPNKRLNAHASFHKKRKQQNAPGDMQGLAFADRNTFTFNMDYEVPMKWSVRTRVQAGTFKLGEKSGGYAIAQDFGRHFPKTELSARLAYFHTDGYDSRQYIYEKDVLYAFSIPAYYDKGFRYYFMARYNVTKSLKCWLRWSQTQYAHLDKISSGLNEIQGNKRSEIKAQLMYQW